MNVTAISPAECSEIAVSALDVDDAADLFSAEGLAASLRRAASYLCPAPPQQVTNAVLDALRPLAPGGGLQRADITDLLDLLVSGGDLIEMRLSGSGAARLLYLGPPSYIEARPGRYLLTGIRPFGKPLISTSLTQDIQYEGPYPGDQPQPGQGPGPAGRGRAAPDPPRALGPPPSGDTCGRTGQPDAAEAIGVPPGRADGGADGHWPGNEGHLLPGPVAAPGPGRLRPAHRAPTPGVRGRRVVHPPGRRRHPHAVP